MQYNTKTTESANFTIKRVNSLRFRQKVNHIRTYIRELQYELEKRLQFLIKSQIFKPYKNKQKKIHIFQKTLYQHRQGQA